VAYSKEMDDNSSKFSRADAAACVNKILFTTEDGMRGSGLKSMLPGDQVWLVKDGRMLLAL
jgi:hypothetical protein